jgi:hypothetical protein
VAAGWDGPELGHGAQELERAALKILLRFQRRCDHFQLQKEGCVCTVYSGGCGLRLKRRLMKTTMFLLATILIAVVPPARGMTKWSAQYTGVTYAAVTASTHGIQSPYIGVLCTDSGGNRLTLDQVSWTVDQTTYEVDITFTNSFTGTVRLSGPWPSSDTSNSTDFAVVVGQSNSSRLNICSQCATYTARRTYNSNTYTADGLVSLIWVSFPAPTVYVYLRENIPTFGLDQGGCEFGSYTLVGVANVECGVTSMPSGVVPLASAAIGNGEFTSVTDLRPW